MSLEEILAEIPKLTREEADRLRRALLERGREAPTVHELGANLFDGVDDLPADLSTDPKYMERFGR